MQAADNKENVGPRDPPTPADKEPTRKELLEQWKEQKRKAESTPSGDRPTKVPKTPQAPAVTPAPAPRARVPPHKSAAVGQRDHKTGPSVTRTPHPAARAAAAPRHVERTPSAHAGVAVGRDSEQRKRERHLLRYIGNHMDNPHGMFGTPPKNAHAVADAGHMAAPRDDVMADGSSPSESVDAGAGRTLSFEKAEVELAFDARTQLDSASSGAESEGPCDVPRQLSGDAKAAGAEVNVEELRAGYAKMADTLRAIAAAVGAPTDPVRSADAIKSWVLSLVSTLRAQMDEIKAENAQLRVAADALEKQKQLTEEAENMSKYFSMMYKMACVNSTESQPQSQEMLLSSTPFGTPRRSPPKPPVRDVTPAAPAGDPIALARSLTEGISEEDARGEPMDCSGPMEDDPQLLTFLSDEEEARRASLGQASPSPTTALNRTITIDRRESRGSFFSASDEIVVAPRASQGPTVVRNAEMQTDDFVGRVLRAAKVAVGECDRLRFSNEILLQTILELRSKLESSEKSAADRLLMLEGKHKEEITEWQELLHNTVQDMNANLQSALRASVEKNKAMQMRLERSNERVALLESTLRALGHEIPDDVGLQSRRTVFEGAP